jgi:hypothetical protein
MAATLRRARNGPPRLLVAALAATLVACGDSGLEAQLMDYAEEVRSAIGAPEAEPPPLAPPFPRRRDRTLEVEDRRIGMLDFLSLQGCKLGELAGYRTRRLVYELEVLEAGEACLDGLGAERRERLRALLTAKRADLPLHVWNALWSGPELEGFLSRSEGAQLGTPDDDAPASLAEIRRRLGRDVLRAEDAVAIEAELARLRDELPLGVSLRRLDAARRHLDAVAGWLEQQPPGPCAGRAVTLTRIFQEVYLPLQPDLARLDRRVAETLPILAEIEREVAARVSPSAPMTAYGEAWLGTEHAESLWPRYRAALLFHAAAWDPILRACGVLTASNSS